MKVLGYGWIKAGETLQSASEKYGVSKEDIIKEGTDSQLLASVTDVKRDVKKSLNDKKIRKHAKPRMFRVILEEVEA